MSRRGRSAGRSADGGAGAGGGRPAGPAQPAPDRPVPVLRRGHRGARARTTVKAFPNRWPPMPDERCEIVLYTPEHEATFASLGRAGARKVVDLWAERTAALGARDDVAYVLVFENRGPEVGRHHPPPPRPDLRLRRDPAGPRSGAGGGRLRRCARHRPPTWSSPEAGRLAGPACPRAADWPYGLLVAPDVHVPDLPVTGRRRPGRPGRRPGRRLRPPGPAVRRPMPYMAWFHQRPTDGGDWPTAHVHLHIAPLHRSPGTPRFVAAAEVGAGIFFNPVAPEAAAQASAMLTAPFWVRHRVAERAIAHPEQDVGARRAGAGAGEPDRGPHGLPGRAGAAHGHRPGDDRRGRSRAATTVVLALGRPGRAGGRPPRRRGPGGRRARMGPLRRRASWPRSGRRRASPGPSPRRCRSAAACRPAPRSRSPWPWPWGSRARRWSWPRPASGPSSGLRACRRGSWTSWPPPAGVEGHALLIDCRSLDVRPVADARGRRGRRGRLGRGPHPGRLRLRRAPGPGRDGRGRHRPPPGRHHAGPAASSRTRSPRPGPAT